MKLGSKLIARIPKICKCGTNFLARQANSIYCDKCREELQSLKPCICGCGNLTKKKYSTGCRTRGKSYKEIYQDREIRSGFKKGLLNPNYTASQFQRFKLKAPDEYGNLFRSALEANFSNFCINNKISYEYEVRVPLIDGRVKVVDFVLDRCIFIEITGYAYSKWQADFDDKFSVLRRTTNKPILVLTYPNKLLLVRNNNRSKDVFFESVLEESRILQKIDLFKNMLLINNSLSYVN